MESPKIKRTKRIGIRVTELELERINDLSREYGFKNISEYITYVACNAKIIKSVSFVDNRRAV